MALLGLFGREWDLVSGKERDLAEKAAVAGRETIQVVDVLSYMSLVNQSQFLVHMDFFLYELPSALPAASSVHHSG